MVKPMKITAILDDNLVLRAQELTGLNKISALLDAALRALIERESARRLALLGGTMPELCSVRRRR